MSPAFRDLGVCPKCLQPGRSSEGSVAELTAFAAALNIKPALAEGLIGWIIHGHMPGGFLTAVLENDLAEAATRADRTQPLWDLVIFLSMHAPKPCWGSKEKVTAWELRMDRAMAEVGARLPGSVPE